MTRIRTLIICVLTVAFCFTWGTTYGVAQQATPPSPAMREASVLFQAQKWAEAAKAYQAITEAEPKNGIAWTQLGASLIKMGKYSEATSTLQRAVEVGNHPVAMYNLACAYAKLDDKDKAFEWLNKSISAGFPRLSLISTDSDLDSLRADARFKDVELAVDKIIKPCMYSEVHRQFDFWVGQWTVTTPQGQQAGTNHVKMLEDGCVIEENWTGSLGGTGKSLNFFDSTAGKWRQVWVGSGGGVSEFAGKYSDGAMRFEGESHLPNGQKILRRLTFFNLGKDKVRQFSEASVDDGKTWNVNYDFTYTRNK